MNQRLPNNPGYQYNSGLQCLFGHLSFSGLSYKQKSLCFGHLSVDELAARFGTPLYVYDFDRVAKRALEYLDIFPSHSRGLVCFAVKANPSLALLTHLGRMGIGADVVSEGELRAALRSGITPEKIVFSGVGKSSNELHAAVEAGIRHINIESVHEIDRIEAIAKALGQNARVSIRFNPDVAADTHPKIATGLKESKFGLTRAFVLEAARKLKETQFVALEGLSIHIGSQIMNIDPVEESLHATCKLADELGSMGLQITEIDCGGGVGMEYDPSVNSQPIEARMLDYKSMLERVFRGRKETLILEPGRSMVADCGVLLSKIIDIKSTDDREFVIIDAGMNDLMRPAMYEAYHHILTAWNGNDPSKVKPYDIVGPVCETSDIFGQARLLSNPVAGGIVAIAHAGAYGMSMASNYNLRPFCKEVAIIKGNPKVIRKAQTIADLWRGQQVPDAILMK